MRFSKTFVRSLLDLDPNASVIVAGDMNEYLATRAVLRPLSAVLHDANEVAGVPPAERYTYAYDQNAQEIDHVFVSEAIAQRRGGVLSGAGSGVEVEHVHVNTWAETIGSRASDHDPTVVRLWVCDPEAGESPYSAEVGLQMLTEVVVQDEWSRAAELGEDHGQTIL